MKTVWNIIAIMSFAHLMAILGFVGWLLNSGRLNEERVEDVRAMFAETIAEEKAREAEEREDREAAAQEAELEQTLEEPVISAANLVAARVEASEVDRQRLSALQRDIRTRREALERDLRRLEQEEAALEADREAFKDMRASIAEQEGDEQFRKSLSVIEGMQPADSATALLTMVEAGRRECALGYLDEMEERARTKVMSQIVGEDPVVAAELLEALRVRGVEVAGP